MIRVRVKGDKKAMIRFGDQREEQWFQNMMRSIRDSDPRTHPKISIRDRNGEIPMLPKPPVGKDGKPIVPQKLTPEMIEKMKIQPMKGKPINVPQKPTPEMIKKMEIQQPMKVQPLVKGKPIGEKKK